MTNTYTGTVTINATVFNVTASLALSRGRVTGTIVFDADPERVFPISVKLTSDRLSFTTSMSTWFIDPAGDSIELTALSAVDTSTTTTLETVGIAAAACKINGVPSTLSLSLTQDAEEAALGIANSGEGEVERTLQSIERVRVNIIGNVIDSHSLVNSLERNPGETNAELKRRLQSVIAQRPGGDKYSIAMSIAREIGVSHDESILVEPLESPAGGDKIRFVMDGVYVKIYTEWMPIEIQETGREPVLEQEILLEGLTITKLVDWINTSANYKAKVLQGGNEKAEMLELVDSYDIFTETLNPTEVTVFKKQNLIPGTLNISTVNGLKSGLLNEVSSASAVTTRGEYYIDYANGLMYTVYPPDEELEVSYSYNKDKIYCTNLRVAVKEVNSEEFGRVLFNQVEKEFYTSEEDRYKISTPTNYGYDIIRKLLAKKRFNQYWGE